MLCKETIVSGARNQDTRRKIAEVSQTGKGKIQIGNPGMETGNPYPAIIVGNRAIFRENVEERGGAKAERGGTTADGTAETAETDRWRICSRVWKPCRR